MGDAEMSDHGGDSGAEDVDINIDSFLDRFPKRRRNDVMEMALEEFRDAWVKEIIVRTSYIGGVDTALLEKIFSFLDLPSAVAAMHTCSTWSDVICSSSMDMWLCWCANTAWKFDFPVPTNCADLKKYGIVRYRSEHRWLKGAVHPPVLAKLYNPEAEPPNFQTSKMHFHDNTLAFFDQNFLRVLDLNNPMAEIKTVAQNETDKISSISVNRGHIAAGTSLGNVLLYKDSLELVETLPEKVPGNIYIHMEDYKLTVASTSCVRIFDLNTKTSFRLPAQPRLSPFRITSIDVCGNLLVQANAESKLIEVWDIEQQKQIKSFPCGNLTKGLRIDARGISGIEATTLHSFYNSVLKVWDMRTLTLRTIYPTFTSDTFQNHFMHEGKIVISCASDSIQVWNGSVNVPMYSIPVPWDNTAHQIDKIQCDWEKIVVGYESGALYMWNFN